MPLLIWRRIILLYALMLGLEGPALLLAAYRFRRPRGERLLTLAPVAAFCALLVVARALSDTYVYWVNYTAWEETTYPPNFWSAMLAQTAREAAPSAQGAAPLGIGVAVLTAALLIGGWALMIRWQSPPAPRPRVAAAPTSTADTEDADNLEINVEPIETVPVETVEAIPPVEVEGEAADT